MVDKHGVRKYEGHLLNRMVDRIGEDFNPISLKMDLVRALGDPERYRDYIEKVKTLKDGASVWRFRVYSDQLHYVIVSEDENPMTVITQKMLRRYKK